MKLQTIFAFALLFSVLGFAQTGVAKKPPVERSQEQLATDPKEWKALAVGLISVVELPMLEVKGKTYYERSEISVSGVKVSEAMWSDFRGLSSKLPGMVRFRIPEGALAFKAIVGVNDAVSARSKLASQDYGLIIYLDGNRVYRRTFFKGDKAKEVTIDLKGARTMSVELFHGASLGAPVIYTKETSTPSVNELIRPLLVGPEVGFKSKGEVTLEWKVVPKATQYVIELIATKLNAPNPEAVRLRSFTVIRASKFVLDTKTLAPGLYRWSVLAFDDQSRIGKFSEDRLLIVQTPDEGESKR